MERTMKADMDESYLREKELHLRINVEIDKPLLFFAEDEQKLIDHDLRKYFEAAMIQLFECRKRYETLSESKTAKKFQYDMYVFSKDELNLYVSLMNEAHTTRLIEQGDL